VSCSALRVLPGKRREVGARPLEALETRLPPIPRASRSLHKTTTSPSPSSPRSLRCWWGRQGSHALLPLPCCPPRPPP